MAATVTDSRGPRLSEYWLLQFLGWGGFATVSFLTLLPVVAPGLGGRLAATKLARAALGLLISEVLRRLYGAFRTAQLPALVRMVASGLAIGAAGVVWYVLFVLVTSLWGPPGAPGLRWADVPHSSLDSVVVLGAWSAAYVAVRHWRRAEEAERAAAAAGARAYRAELDALRYQLNPHFLFNALNSIRTQITENPGRARDMITGFADLLRRLLDVTATNAVPLRDEVATIENYVAIERVRFGDDLDVRIDIDRDAADWLVPTFVLQPLVENAITHGRRTSVLPVRVRITATLSPDRLRLEVANTGCLRSTGQADSSSPSETAGVAEARRALGVASVRERLGLLLPDRHLFSLAEDDGWVRAIIELHRVQAQSLMAS